MKRPSYAWTFVYLSAAILAVNAFPIYGFGVFLTPLTTEFGWERGALSYAVSVAMLLSGVVSIAVGRLSDRYGPRVFATIAGVVLGAGMLLMSRVDALWQVFLIWGIALGIGLSCSVTPINAAIPRWFTSQRGMAVSISAAGFGLGSIVTPVVVERLISQFDWRTAFLLLALVPLLITVPLAQFLRVSPADSDARDKVQETSAGAVPDTGKGLSYREAARTGQFWLFGLMWLGFALCMQTIVVHMVAHGIDTGMSPVAAAATLSIVATSSVFGKLVSGFVADRIGSRILLALCLGLLTIAIGPLVFAREPWLFYMCALAIGLAHGMGVPMLTVVPADMFGLRSLGAVFGVLFFMGNVGGAIGPPLSGWIFDVTRSYAVAFLVATIVGGASFVLGLLLVRSKQATAAMSRAKAAKRQASSV